MGPADVPSLALAIRIQHERALACADQYPYAAHRCSFQPRPGDAARAGPAPGIVPPDPAAPIDSGLSRPPDSYDGRPTENSSPGFAVDDMPTRATVPLATVPRLRMPVRRR